MRGDHEAKVKLSKDISERSDTIPVGGRRQTETKGASVRIGMRLRD